MTTRATSSRASNAPGDLDVLSDTLDLLRLRGEVLCWSDLSAPWGLIFDPDEALFFHLVEAGRCLLRPAGAAWTQLAAGDLAVLPAAGGHVLSSSAAARAVPLASVVDPAGQLPGALTHGGGGARTRVLCGRFRYDARMRALLPALPPVLVVRGTAGRAAGSLGLTLGQLEAEGGTEQPGRNLAMSRLVDLLLVQALREWISSGVELPRGWLLAMRDPRIALALSRMHAAPDEPWSVPRLARESGMSRSSFADRFVALLGEPPSRYLTRWRIHLASRLLRRPGTSVAEVASQVGYDSEAAFSRAFRRVLGVPPGTFRRRATQGPAIR